MWKSLAATVAFALVDPTLGVAQDAMVSQKSVPDQIMDALNGVFGVHPGARATHATTNPLADLGGPQLQDLKATYKNDPLRTRRFGMKT